jgi:hypothetical protein
LLRYYDPQTDRIALDDVIPRHGAEPAHRIGIAPDAVIFSMVHWKIFAMANQTPQTRKPSLPPGNVYA